MFNVISTNLYLNLYPFVNWEAAMTDLPTSEVQELIKYLKANLILQLHKDNEDASSTRPEDLLLRAGFSVKEISDLTGKKYDTVQKMFARAKPKGGSKQ
jgi:hypothetical protein